MKKYNATDEYVVTLAEQLGSEPKAVAAMLNQNAYRKRYNSKPRVKAARALYNKARNAELAKLRQLVKSHPELLQVAEEQE